MFQVFYLGEGDGGEDVNDLELETALLNWQNCDLLWCPIVRYVFHKIGKIAEIDEYQLSDIKYNWCYLRSPVC